MTSRLPENKAPKGAVQIIVSNSRLQIRFRFGGKRHYLSIGLTDSPTNRKLAEMKARQIELDIISENFDLTLKKYKPGSALSTADSVTPISTPKLLLGELWQSYTDFKRPQCSPSTMNNSFKRYANCIKRLPTQKLEDAVEIRNYCLSEIPIISCKRFIIQLSACCKWAVSSGLIDENPFHGMSEDIKLPKAQHSEFDDINPFTVEEREQIIQALKNDVFTKTRRVKRQHQFKHSHYAPYVEFLFLTGCRPSEAIALQWRHISNDFRFIRLEQAVVIGENGKVCKQGLKTQQRRRFPCNKKLQTLLSSIRPENDYSSESLVFPSHEENWIDTSKFQHRV